MQILMTGNIIFIMGWAKNQRYFHRLQRNGAILEGWSL